MGSDAQISNTPGLALDEVTHECCPEELAATGQQHAMEWPQRPIIQILGMKESKSHRKTPRRNNYAQSGQICTRTASGHEDPHSFADWCQSLNALAAWVAKE